MVGSLFIITGDTSHISQTVIDGNRNGSVVIFANGEDQTAVISGFIITNGYASGGGGIFCRNNSNPTLTDLRIKGNTATKGGGISCFENSNPTLENVTVTENSAVSAGGILCWDNSTPKLINTIFWNNQPDEIVYQELFADPSSIEISYSIIKGGKDSIQTGQNGTVQWFDGNINSNPLFVNVAKGDFHLQKDSPGINTGNPNPEFNDLDGSRNDMGVFGGPNAYISNQRKKVSKLEEVTKREKTSFLKRLFKIRN